MAKKKAAGRRPAARPAPATTARASARRKPLNNTGRRAAAATDVPSLFRINVEVGSLDDAAEFYSELFGLEGRKQAGSRCYFRCGPVTLQVVDVSSVGTPHPAAKALYFTVRDLDAVFVRAQALDCLSRDSVHGTAAGAISVKPWGERSFYAEDRWKNPLCFVEAGTIYRG